MVYFPYHRDKLLALASVDPYTAWYDFEYSRSLHDVANLVSYFNATFNFAIYVFSGSKFRAELRSLLCLVASLVKIDFLSNATKVLSLETERESGARETRERERGRRRDRASARRAREERERPRGAASAR
ncbi:hypothetical protein DPMN_144138 [Dreissena polymorpha]|uniref:Uncharacterized protein n=1 Tax=Dreissena polymorpha TaxID=45954 RepID=A0A9D4GIC6_DREPO|nr:hypothetical protein DPMN_144138 [Dreissena polymorpha]